jgi:hypothetical protein
MIVSVLRLSIVHVWIVVMIGVGAIIDGIVVVVPIVAHWFILHVTEMVITTVRPCHRVLEKPKIKPETKTYGVLWSP